MTATTQGPGAGLEELEDRAPGWLACDWCERHASRVVVEPGSLRRSPACDGHGVGAEFVRPGSYVVRIVAYRLQPVADRDGELGYRFLGFVLEAPIIQTPRACRPFAEFMGYVPGSGRAPGQSRPACLCGWRGEVRSWLPGRAKAEAARHAGGRWVLCWCVGIGRHVLERVT